MPGANLTRIEAEERKSIIAAPIHYTVKLDLTRGAKDFGSETTITFDAKPGESSFLDLIANEVSEITLNGETLDPAEAYADSRDRAEGPTRSDNEVTVKASVPVLQRPAKACTAASTRPTATSTCTPSSKCRTPVASTPCSTSLI